MGRIVQALKLQNKMFSRFFNIMLSGLLAFGGTLAVTSQVAYAATLHSEASAMVSTAAPYSSGLIDALGHTNLQLSFDYDAELLDDGDSFTYGWSSGGTDTDLNTVSGIHEAAGTPSDEVGSVMASLPAGAQVSDLELYVTVTGDAASDEVNLTNIALNGDIVAADATITSTLTTAIVGVTENFTTSIDELNDTDELVRVKTTLTNPSQAGDINLEYETSPGSGVFLPLSFDGSGVMFFGPATGFPIEDATTNMRATFSAPGTYDSTVEIVKVSDGTTIGTPLDQSITVTLPTPATISTNLATSTDVCTGLEDFTVSTTANDDAGTLVRAKVTLLSGNASDVTLQYKEVVGPDAGTYQPLTFTGNTTFFGPATGFPLSDATSEFKIDFAATGTYSFLVELVDPADTSVVIGDTLRHDVSVNDCGPATPALAITFSDLTTSDTTPTLTGTVNNPAAVVTVSPGDGNIYTATISGNTWTAQVTTPLTPGTYSPIVHAEVGTFGSPDFETTDVVGNLVITTASTPGGGSMSGSSGSGSGGSTGDTNSSNANSESDNLPVVLAATNNQPLNTNQDPVNDTTGTGNEDNGQDNGQDDEGQTGSTNTNETDGEVLADEDSNESSSGPLGIDWWLWLVILLGLGGASYYFYANRMAGKE